MKFLQAYVITALLLLVCAFGAFAQTSDPVTLPTYVGAGVAFNQIGVPRVNLWAGAFYPVSSSKGVYLSTVADIVPVLQLDPVTKRQFYAFSTSIRQGAHKTIWTAGKFTALLGGDAGAGFSQASPSGVNVNFAGSFTATGVYQLSAKFAIVVPIRALWMGDSKTWNALPEFGVLFKP
jgi:ABC-type molybdate transport system substrate-binding protein